MFGGASDIYFVFMTQGHPPSGIPTPPLIILAAETGPLCRPNCSFWCGHEKSFSRRRRQSLFPADVHSVAFGGRRGNPAHSALSAAGSRGPLTTRAAG